MRRMAAWAGDHLDRQVFRAFVKGLGIYPVGRLARLESGLPGVVVEQSKSSLLQPRVRVFHSTAARAYVRPPTIDLTSTAAREGMRCPAWQGNGKLVQRAAKASTRRSPRSPPPRDRVRLARLCRERCALAAARRPCSFTT